MYIQNDTYKNYFCEFDKKTDETAFAATFG